jgi:pimeloyl-ACP methyl ester carboxylesterase
MRHSMNSQVPSSQNVFATEQQTFGRFLRGMRRAAAAIAAVLACGSLPSISAAQPLLAEATARSMRADAAGFAGVKDPAVAFFQQNGFEGRLEQTAWLGDLLDQVHTLHHDVPIGGGRTLAVTETFTLRSWLRFPARGVLFLNGSAFVGNHWAIPVTGYDGARMVAQRSGFAFTVDYLGTGESYKPANGTDASFRANKEAIATLVRYIRTFRLIPKIDLVGEGYGGGIAAELASDALRIRSVSMAAMVYREIGGGPLTDPGFVAFLQSMPDGYFFNPGEGSLMFTQGAPQAVKDYIAATQGGFYPTPNFLVATQRPFFNVTRARVPGLVLYGKFDPIGVRADLEDMVAEWGGDGSFAFNDFAGHAPRTESPAIADWFWTSIFEFIDL